jgi:hypothetical protein
MCGYATTGKLRPKLAPLPLHGAWCLKLASTIGVGVLCGMTRGKVGLYPDVGPVPNTHVSHDVLLKHKPLLSLARPINWQGCDVVDHVHITPTALYIFIKPQRMRRLELDCSLRNDTFLVADRKFPSVSSVLINPTHLH